MNAVFDSRPVSGSLERLYFPLLAGFFGISVLSGITWLIPVYFSLAYIILSLTLLSVTRGSRDWLNPLLLVLSAGFIRFSIPGLLASVDLDSAPEALAMMGLDREDWILGHALAVIGLLGVVIGWFLGCDLFATLLRRIKVMNLSYSGGVPYAAILGMLVGFAALFMFVRSHASFGEAIYTGEMRGTEVQVGTGKYFHLSLMFIASSVVFSAYLDRKNSVWWITLLPTALTASCFFILGGRARTFVPVGAALLLLWYRRDKLRVSLPMVALTGVLLPVFAFAGVVYRGVGLGGVKQIFSMSTLAGYVQYAVWLDWGQLHALAGATAIGPGGLEGQTFLTLLWPLSKFLNLPMRSAGTFLAETLFGFGERQWSYHAALIGDAYLNFGLNGVLVVTIIFGAIVKELYVRMRQGRMNKAIYALIIIYSIRIFFEGVEEFSEMLVVLIFAILVIKLGQIFNVGHREA